MEAKEYWEKVFADDPALVPRKIAAEKTGSNYRSWANRDSAGTGVKERILLRGRTFYPKQKLIDHLVKNSEHKIEAESDRN